MTTQMLNDLQGLGFNRNEMNLSVTESLAKNSSLTSDVPSSSIDTSSTTNTLSIVNKQMKKERINIDEYLLSIANEKQSLSLVVIGK